jgi:Ribose/xylose/arabinose/galactoside ABC-type transport systems, permease components
VGNKDASQQTAAMQIDENGMLAASMKDKIVHFLFKYGMLIILLALVAFFSIATDHFFTVGNMMDILRSVTIITLISLGVTITLVVNGFDMSVGSVSSLAVVVASATMVIHLQGPVMAVIYSLIAGMIVGLLNGLLIVKIKIPHILATLGMMFFIQGVQLTYSMGYPIYHGATIRGGQKASGNFSQSFLDISQGYVGVIPIPVIIVFIVLILVYLFLNHTYIGRNMYVIGGNMEAAKLSGIRVGFYIILAYVLSGLLTSMGGVVLAARIGIGDVLAGSSFLLDGVAASFIGYALLGAGKPNVWGTFIGAVFMGVLLTGMTMLGTPYYMQDIFKGIVLISALALSFYLRKQGSTG